MLKAGQSSAIVLACGFGGVWLIIQARLEGIDLVQRLPEYQEYLEQLRRFLPRIRNRKP